MFRQGFCGRARIAPVHLTIATRCDLLVDAEAMSVYAGTGDGRQHMRHVTVYREAGRYGGWPANYGIWAWGDEIVVGFTLGYHKTSAGFHARDRSRPFVTMQARTVDGGATWSVESLPADSPGGRGLSADEHMEADLGLGSLVQAGHTLPGLESGVDLAHPDFALMCARSGLRAGALSWFYVSHDRCNSWHGPYRLPTFGQPGIAARTDYVIDDAATGTLFLTATKRDGDEGRVFCARTTDGGVSFSFVSWVCDEPPGYAIMPASVRLDSGRMLTAIRYRNGQHCWIDLFASDDDGLTWDHVGRPAADTGQGGNPPAMILLRDGRLCLSYGCRDPPFAMRARLSSDGGFSWGKEVVLRSGAGNHDIGYPRSAQRSDGAVVTVYYWNDHPDTERYIAATIWKP